MADSTFTSTGYDALLRGINNLPGEVTAELKTAAVRIGHKQQEIARRLLLERTRNDKTPETQATATAAAIEVFVDADEKKVQVVSRGVSGDPANNPIWLEYGTVHQLPKPYMRPANDATREEYRALCETGALKAARKAFGG